VRRDRPELVRGTGLSKAFGAKSLFDGLDVTVHAGERVALTGPSGAGKTTLGNVLLGLAAPDAGSVDRSSALADGRLQKLYQDPAQAFPARVPLDRSIRDVVRRHRCDPDQLSALLPALGLDPALLARRPGQVSGGELQRIAIARAVLLRPALLFADEPTSRFDLLTQEETVRCLMEQLAPHDWALVLGQARRGSGPGRVRPARDRRRARPRRRTAVTAAAVARPGS
jgi:peptide/nickel transport system ATP-binding protein